MKLALIIGFSVFMICPLWSQADSIILLNGKVYRGTITSVNNGLLQYMNSENEKIELTTDRLYSYFSDGKETICYTENEFTGDFLTVDEARRTTLGSYDARQTFKPRFVLYSSIAIGLGLSLIDTYFTQSAYDAFFEENNAAPTNATVGFFGIQPTMMPMLAPLILSASWGIPSFRIKSDQILQKNLYGDENYYRGYHRIAKQKRIFAALTGSAIGIATGMISYYIFTPN